MEIDVQITGMRCESCCRQVERALDTLDGIERREVHVGQALVAFNDRRVSRTQVLDKIRDAGNFHITGFSRRG